MHQCVRCGKACQATFCDDCRSFLREELKKSGVAYQSMVETVEPQWAGASPASGIESGTWVGASPASGIESGTRAGASPAPTVGSGTRAGASPAPTVNQDVSTYTTAPQPIVEKPATPFPVGLDQYETQVEQAVLPAEYDPVTPLPSVGGVYAAQVEQAIQNLQD